MVVEVIPAAFQTFEVESKECPASKPEFMSFYDANGYIFNGVDMTSDETFYVVCGAYLDTTGELALNKYQTFISQYSIGYALQWQLKISPDVTNSYAYAC